MGWCGVLIAGLVAASLCAAPELRWDFSSPKDVAAVNRLYDAVVVGGQLKGLSAWDPYFHLRLPAGGIKAADYRGLQVRLFSSAPADVLDIYYKSAAGYWCLGGSLPIKAGWAVYSVDLEKNHWRETTQGDIARHWGGKDGQVISLRLDPGNEADRWIMVDWVRLTAQPLPTEVKPEPRATIEVVGVQAPQRLTAGDELPVTLRVKVSPSPQVPRATAYARLQTPTLLMATAEQEFDASRAGEVTVRLKLPTLPRVAARANLHVGVYEALSPDEEPDDVRGQVEVQVPSSVARDFPGAEIRRLGGSPALYVAGKPVPFFCISAPRGMAQLDPSAQSIHARMARAGVPIFSDWFGTSVDGFLGRLAPGKYDYSSFDAYFSRVLRRAPHALFLPHIYVTAPVWWQKAHPDELCQYHDGGKGPQSFASELWRQEIGDDLVRLLCHWRSAPYADQIIGVVVCSGYTAEWQSWGLWRDKFVDYSAPAVRRWRTWLREKYTTDDALRRAWRRPKASIDTAEPPTAAERQAASHLMLRDPAQEQFVLDYLIFLNDLTADAINYFAHLAKQASDRRLLVGTYYGYLTQHQWHQAESGHCGIEKVLASPDVDFLMSPPTYTQRKAGEVSAFMGATDSVHAHGKIWLSEADYRTHLSDPSAGYGRTANMAQTLGVLWREFAHDITKRAAVSHMDMAGGWFADPQIEQAFGKMVRLMREDLRSRQPWHAQVAVFVDPRSFYYVRPGPIGTYLSLQPVLNFFRAGAPFDLYVLSDLEKAD
ncbi:MAG: beta-galactosidase, partial [Armatimonadetes bacterium]|nr:beta-galactosidase [Armatimonadota bacterium]